MDGGASADDRPRLIPAGQICPALFVCDHYSISGMTDEAHLSAQPTRSEATPRLSFALGDGRRPQGAGRAPRERPLEAVFLRQITERRDFPEAQAGTRLPLPGFMLLVRA